jgi:hypothetical protein
MKELEIDELRCSFGWDDYEPLPGLYDFTWLQDFVTLAAEHDIQLRPYIGYTPEWAGVAGSQDGAVWNNPPADPRAWRDFVYQLAWTLRDAPNVLSYEIYNEENVPLWWDGTVEQYMETLRTAAQAIQEADPNAQVLLGGLVFPDDDWLLPILDAGYAQYYDVTPFHAYPETWIDAPVEGYLDTQYRDFFVPYNDDLGQGEPIWINEMGYATTPGRTEEQQANWFARAVSTFLAEPEIEYIGIYEIKDLAPDKAAIGDAANYHLGLARTDHSKKLAFATVDLLTDLLDTGTITIADDDMTVHVTAGRAEDLHYHLFRRPDARQVLFIYDKEASPTLDITLQTRGARAILYQLDGSSAPYTAFDGTTLHDVELQAGAVTIFAIHP